LAGGVRQSILLLLLPLWLGATIVGIRRLRTVVVGVGIIAVAVMAWFVPMIWLTGGLDRYLAASVDLAETVVKPTSILGGDVDTTLRMARYLVESVLVGLGPLALAAFFLPWYVRRRGWGSREWLLVAWTVPPVLVYTLVHFGQAGYALTFLPALVVLLSAVLVSALGHAAAFTAHAWLRPAAIAAAVAVVVFVNGSFFVNARPLPRDFETPKSAWMKMAEDEAFDWIFSRTAAALREHEEVVRTFMAAITGQFSPDDTAVITELGNPRSYPWMRHAVFYLREYPIYELQVGELPAGYYAPQVSLAMTRVHGSEIRLPAGIKRLVWFVDHWSPTSERPPGLMEIEIPYGRFLYVLPVGRKPVSYAGYTLIREEPPRRAGRLVR